MGIMIDTLYEAKKLYSHLWNMDDDIGRTNVFKIDRQWMSDIKQFKLRGSTSIIYEGS